MSIRTTDDLSRCLDADLAWRKKELSALKYFIDQPTENKGRRLVLSRCGIAILYAHWEGYIKCASKNFLEYVAMQRLQNEQLKPNFLTISMCNSVSVSSNSKKYSEFEKITMFFQNNLSSHAHLPYRKGLDTESNLSSKVLKEMLWCLGISYSLFETKEKFIDSRLVDRRNHIAHGQDIDVDPSEFEEMRDIVIDMLTVIKNELENSAISKNFQVSSQSN